MDVNGEPCVEDGNIEEWLGLSQSIERVSEVVDM